MIYTIGTGSGRNQIALSVLQESVEVLKISRILDWREAADGELDAVRLRSAFADKYRFVGNRCNTGNIRPDALERLCELDGQTLLIFEEPIPALCPRHAELALVLARRGKQVKHLLDNEVILATELQRSIRENTGYEYEPLVRLDQKKLAPLTLPKNIDVKKAAELLREAAVCISVERHGFGNIRKLSGDAVADAINQNRDEDAKIDAKRVGGHKKLLRCPELDALNSHDGRITSFLQRHAMPSPFGGTGAIYFIRISQIEYVDGKMIEFAREREQLRDQLCNAYDLRVGEAEKELGSDFDLSQYKSKEELRASIVMTYQFIEFGTPGGLRQVSPEILRREQEKLTRQYTDGALLVQQAMYASLKKLVDHMVELVQPAEDGKQKIYKAAAIDNIKEFLGTVGDRNLINDERLTVLAERARLILKGVDTNIIRDNDSARAYVATGFEQIQSVLATMVTDKPKRAFRVLKETQDAA